MSAAADLLAAIVAATRKAVAVRQEATPIDVLEGQVRRRPAGGAFVEALRSSAPPRIIAECKRRSPSRGILRAAYDPASHAVAYARAGAAAISVLTEPAFFDGDPEHLADVRAAVDIPILRKDFVVSRYQIVEAAVLGADAVLLIVSALGEPELRALIAAAGDLGLATLVEVHEPDELPRALNAGATVVGVNSRNLRTLSVDREVLLRTAEAIPEHVVAVAESGIRESADLVRLSAAGYDAFLIGERLMSAPDPGEALKALRG